MIFIKTFEKFQTHTNNIIDIFIDSYTTNYKKYQTKYDSYNKIIDLLNLSNQDIKKELKKLAINSLSEIKINKKDIIKFVEDTEKIETYKTSFIDMINNFKNDTIYIYNLEKIFPVSYIESFIDYYIENNYHMAWKENIDYLNLKKWIENNKNNNKLTIYRALDLPKEYNKMKKLTDRFSGIGIFWTYSEKDAKSYFSDCKDCLEDNPFNTLIKADVEWSDINWVETIIKSLYSLSHEKEIELYPETTIYVKEIYFNNEKNIVNNYLNT